MVPVSVPPSVPLPVFKLNETEVSLLTTAAFPLLSWDWTATGKEPPTLGLAPLLTDAMTSFVGELTVSVLLTANRLKAPGPSNNLNCQEPDGKFERGQEPEATAAPVVCVQFRYLNPVSLSSGSRSEERRVGEEWRSRWS